MRRLPDASSAIFERERETFSTILRSVSRSSARKVRPIAPRSRSPRIIYDRGDDLSAAEGFRGIYRYAGQYLPREFRVSFIKFAANDTLNCDFFIRLRAPFYPTYVRRSFHCGKRKGRISSLFSVSLSSSLPLSLLFLLLLFRPVSFRHPLVPFLRTRLKTRRPPVKWGFDGWGVFDDLFVDNLRNSDYISKCAL